MNVQAPARKMQTLLLWAAILPLATINLSYLVAVAMDHVPACITYLTGCTSVSSTGRQAPESYLFRAGMLFGAGFMLIFWWHFAQFRVIGNPTRVRLVVVRALGVGAAVSLVLYATMLGLRGDLQIMLRRTGINGFAVCNYVLQLMFVVYYATSDGLAKRSCVRWLVALCIALPGVGIVSELAKSLGVDRHTANNMAAWNAFVVMALYYGVLYRIWRHHQFDNRSSGLPASPAE